MADISKLSRLLNGVQRQVDLASNTLVVNDVKFGGASGSLLEKADVDALTLTTDSPSAVDASSLHHHDGRYFTETELGSTADGASGASLIGVDQTPAFTNISGATVQAIIESIDTAFNTAGTDEHIKVSANDTTAKYLEDAIVVSQGTNSVNILEVSTLNDGANEDLQIQIDQAKISHDALADFVANEHVDHSSVSIGTAADSGLSGGGDITTSRSLVVDIDGTTELTGVADADTLLIDDGNTGTNRRITRQNLIGSAAIAMGSGFGISLAGGAELTGLPATPSGATAAASKAYVDSLAAGLDPKESVRVASTADVGGTYNGAASPDEITGLAALAIDGVTLAQDDRVLLKDQTDAKQNGIYVYDLANTKLVRSPDQDGSPANEVSGGNFTFVEQGTTNVNSGWVLQGDGILTLDTDNLSWVQFSGAGSITDGDGLSKSGNVLSVQANVTETSTTVASAIDVTASGVAVKVDDATIEGSGQGVAGAESLRVKDLGISTAKLAATSVTAAKLGSDVAGTGLTGGNGSAIAVDFGTTGSKAVSATVLASTTTGQGAALIGVEDSAAQFTGVTVEAVLAEIQDNLDAHEASASAHDAADITYTPSTLADWNGSADPGQTDDAIDQLASRVKTIETEGATAESVIDSAAAGETLTAGIKAIRWAKAADTGFVAGRVYLADKDASSADNFYVQGLLVATGETAGTSVSFVKHGPLTATAHGFTVGEPIYLAASGALTGTAPSTADEAVVRVGMARDANTIEVQIQVMGIN